MANYKVKGNKVIANIAELTEKEIAEIKNYMALGFTLEKKKATKTVTVEDMRKALADDAATLKAFNEAYADNAAAKDFKDTGFAKACKIYTEWKKAQKK